MANVDMNQSVYKTEIRPLHFAASREEEKPELVKLLIELKSDVNAIDKQGNTAAHLAASKGNADSLSLLCLNEAIPSAQNAEKRTPAHLAALQESAGNVDCMDILLNWGADFGIRDVDGWTPTHLAVRKGNIYCLYFLFKHCKENMSVKDHFGKIPQDYVAECISERVCREVDAALNGHDYPLPK